MNFDEFFVKEPVTPIYQYIVGAELIFRGEEK
jgi:hypothetical protein